MRYLGYIMKKNEGVEKHVVERIKKSNINNEEDLEET